MINKSNRKTKKWSVILLVTIITTLMSGYTSREVFVNAQEVEEILPGETTIDENTTTEETTMDGDTTTGGVEDDTPEDTDAYTLMAHRGYSGYAPINSIPAFEKAVAAGFKTIELDVRRCKPEADGSVTWVVSHDDSLKKTAGVDVNISELTYSQIAKYTYTEGNEIDLYKNLKIPTFNQIVDMIAKYKAEGLNINWQIEIKDSSDSAYTEYFEKELIKPIIDAQVEDCVIFSSFNYTYLKKIKSINSDFPTWYLTTILDESAINKATAAQAKGISFKGTIDSTTKENIKNALDAGFELGTYAINSVVIMGAYYQWGVRNFSTDVLSPIDVYEGMLTGTYNVKAFTCKTPKDTYLYNGQQRVPTVTVTYRGEELVEGVNYVVSYENNKYPGTATAHVVGINNCISDSEVDFEIKMPEVTGLKVTSAKTKYVKLNWKQVENVSGYIVYNYNFATKKYEAIKTISNPATVNCKIKNLSGGTKYKYCVRAFVSAEGKTYNSAACEAVTTYTRPENVTNLTAMRYDKYKRMRVKWKSLDKCSGYTIVVATDKKMKNVVGQYAVKGKSSKKLKVKKLKKEQTYYVKIRAYLNIGNTKKYGLYSSVIKVNGKKKK